MSRTLTTCLLALFATAAFGQEARDPNTADSRPASSFAERIDVRVVNLEVVVTDRSGQLVSDLAPEDFELEVDGEPVTIDYFSEIREGRAVARNSQDGPRDAPATVAGESIPSRMLIFIDGAFGMPDAFEPFAQAIAEQAESLRPEEQMALIFYDGKELSVLSDWTSSADELRRALDDVDRRAFRGPERLAEWRSYQRSIQDEQRYVAEGSVRGGRIRPLADLPEFAVTKKRLEREIDRISKAITASLYHWAESDGRKAALLWSGGWPWSSFEFLRPPWSGDLSSAQRSEDSLRQVIDSANRLGYTLYLADSPVDFYGNRAATQHHESLNFMADGTGGRAFKNMHALKAFELAREDVRSFYWLGFTTESQGSGDRLKIRIKSKQRGLKVRSRESWLDLADHELVEQKVQAMALFGALSSDGNDTAEHGAAGHDAEGDLASLDLQFGEPKLTRRNAQVPLTVGIPLRAITMLPGADGYSANLELRISMLDEDGGLNEMPRVPITFQGPEPQDHDVFFYETELKMRRKQQTVTVAIYDAISGALVSGRQQLSF